jgi:hypothetical protein
MANDDELHAIQSQLDWAMSVYLRGGLPTDERMSVDGQMRGLSIALAILRGTSAMQETLASRRRQEGAQLGTVADAPWLGTRTTTQTNK